jgi:tetratricopeptide (TPR) repeat protein
MLDRPTLLSEPGELPAKRHAEEPASATPAAAPITSPTLLPNKQRGLSRIVRARQFFALIGSIGDVAIKLGIIIAVAASGYLVFEAATTRNLSIDEIAVPESLSERGFSSTVVARKLVDGISTVNVRATVVRGRAVRADEAPSSKLPEIYIPVGEVSLQSIARQLRRFLGRADMSIYGEITSETVKIAPPAIERAEATSTKRRRSAADEETEKAEPEEKTLYRVILRSQAGQLVGPPLQARENIDQAIFDASLRIIEHFDPIVAASYYFRTKNGPEMTRMLNATVTNGSVEERKWARLLIGHSYRDIELNRPKALEQYEQLHAEHPDFIWGPTNIAGELRRIGKLPEALAMAEKATLIEPNNGMAHLMVGLTHRSMRNFPAAAAAFDKARQVEPSFERAHANLALVYHGDLRQRDKAKTVLQEGLAILPRGYFLRSQLSIILLSEGKLRESREMAEAAAIIDPDKPNAWYNLMRVADAEGRIDEMLVHAKRGGETSSRDTAGLQTRGGEVSDRLSYGWQLMGDMALKHRRWAELEESTRKALAIDPTGALHRVRLGTALLETNRPKDAVLELAKAIEIQPSNPRAQAEYARALWAQPPNQRKTAIAALSMSAAFAGLPALKKDYAAPAFEIFGAEALRLERAGRTETASIYVREAIGLQPQRANELNALQARLEPRLKALAR